MIYQGIDKTNILIAEFLKLRVIKAYAEKKSIAYQLWAPIVPQIDGDSEEYPLLGYTDICHIYDLKFHTDWNWLMYVVKQIQQQIFIPMDSDLNNITHEDYQRNKESLKYHLENVDIINLYKIIVAILTWWKWREDNSKK